MNKVPFINTGKKPTSEEWASLSAFRKDNPDTRWKHGDVRSDGRVFVQYCPRSKNGEKWVTPEMMDIIRQSKKKYYNDKLDYFTEKSKRWRDANRDHKREQDKEYRNQNKERVKQIQKAYYEIHKDRIKERSKEWYEANKEKVKETGRARYIKNRQQIRKRAKDYYRRTASERQEKSKKWYAKNKDTVKQCALQWKRGNRQRIKVHMKARAKVDPLFALTMSVRVRMKSLILSRGYTKKSPTQEILGCSWANLKAHLEEQFKPGMSWANRSEWHIDHRIPLCSAKTEEELLALCKYPNLQPLWAGENLAKWTTIPD